MNRIVKGRLMAAALVGMAVLAPAQAADNKYTTLKENIFVCISPQAYDDAMARVQALNSRDLEPLKKELSEAQQCMFVDPHMVDNIMAPFAVVLQRDGTKVQVQFIVTFRDRVEFLHRLIKRYVLVGWTDESNLEPKTIL
ncbi:MAG TPA: hypothetical protein VN664_18125 [Burkholderiales bacterium]|jgi:hypothetical protein|nr:hypothetical protein [Burkholderiales bacterium]